LNNLKKIFRQYQKALVIPEFLVCIKSYCRAVFSPLIIRFASAKQKIAVDIVATMNMAVIICQPLILRPEELRYKNHYD